MSKNFDGSTGTQQDKDPSTTQQLRTAVDANNINQFKATLPKFQEETGLQEQLDVINYLLPISQQNGGKQSGLHTMLVEVKQEINHKIIQQELKERNIKDAINKKSGNVNLNPQKTGQKNSTQNLFTDPNLAGKTSEDLLSASQENDIKVFDKGANKNGLGYQNVNSAINTKTPEDLYSPNKTSDGNIGKGDFKQQNSKTQSPLKEQLYSSVTNNNINQFQATLPKFQEETGLQEQQDVINNLLPISQQNGGKQSGLHTMLVEVKQEINHKIIQQELKERNTKDKLNKIASQANINLHGAISLGESSPNINIPRKQQTGGRGRSH